MLFVIGSVASLIAVITLAYPGTQFDAAWRVNPHSCGLTRIRSWSVVLMSAVFVACLFTAIGLSRHLEWGYWLAMVMLIANLTTDVINVIVGTERRAIVGIPIVLTLLLYLSRRKTREYFTQEDRL